MTDPLTFLQSVAGFTRAQTDGSADRPWKIGTIDPAYVKSSFPGTLPKVTFDGESTLSGKTYVVMSGYRPAPSDRVVLAPVGTTYMIVGCLDTDASAYFGGTLDVAGNATVGGTLGVTGTAAFGSTITANSLQVPLGYIEYGNVTAGSVATSAAAAEAAIPTASWAHEPNATFLNGHIYKIEAQYGIGINASSATAMVVRVRRGAQTTSGNILVTWAEQEYHVDFFNTRSRWGYFKNTSGSNITTALSLTIQRTSAANNASLFGDSTLQLRVSIKDLGLESGHILSSIAGSM